MITRRQLAAFAAASIVPPAPVREPAFAQSTRLKAEMAKWGPIIRDAHITMDD